MSDDLLRRTDERGVGALLRPLDPFPDLPGVFQDMLGVYCPTLGRPHALQRLADNVAATTGPYRLVFITEAHDPASYDAARLTGADVITNPNAPSYSNSLQIAYETFDDPFFIGANDDFDFQPGWDTAALHAMQTPGVQVVGIHDGSPQCGFSTISLIDRNYIREQSGVIDIPNRVNYPYLHNYVDTEFHATAVRRGVFTACPDSVILHRHPDWGHAETDATYLKSQSSLSQDATTFASRTHLWQT